MQPPAFPPQLAPVSLQIAEVLQVEPVGQSALVAQDLVQKELPRASSQQSWPVTVHGEPLPQPPLLLPSSGEQT